MQTSRLRALYSWVSNVICLNESFSDTDPKISAMQHKLIRQVGAVQKMAMLGQMNQTVKILALSGLKNTLPQ